MRKPIIAGNWKMNLAPSEAVDLASDLWGRLSEEKSVEVVLCPPFIDIPAVAEFYAAEKVEFGLGAQNMHWAESGAFTGEISRVMLREIGVTHVIIGHSERRQLFGETDQAVNRKVASAMESGLVPIMCVGETLKQRESGETGSVVSGQVRRGLFEIEGEAVDGLIVAYEPIWAIGTGKAATAGDAEDVAALIRSTIEKEFGGPAAEAVRIQYGGSVKADNISEYMSMPDVDGALVGGASLKGEDFAGIVNFS